MKALPTMIRNLVLCFALLLALVPTGLGAQNFRPQKPILHGKHWVAITGKPGLVAFFHCNLLHASGHNLSPDDRAQAYFCYNRVANRPASVENPRPDFVRSTNWVPMRCCVARCARWKAAGYPRVRWSARACV